MTGGCADPDPGPHFPDPAAPKVEDLADTRLAQKISQLPGVGLASISGGQRPAEARLSVTLSTNQYKAGTISTLDLLVVVTAARNNERAAVTILGNRMSASALFIKALGGGWKSSDLPPLADRSADLTVNHDPQSDRVTQDQRKP